MKFFNEVLLFQFSKNNIKSKFRTRNKAKIKGNAR